MHKQGNFTGLSLVLVFTITNSLMARQDAAFQISQYPVLSNLSGAIRVQSIGSVYLGYVSADTVVKGGYFGSGSWTQSVSVKVPYGARLVGDNPIVIAIDENSSVWIVHEDTTKFVRVSKCIGNLVQGIFSLASPEGSNITSLVMPSAICSNYSGGIWFATSLSSLSAAGWFVSGSSPSRLVDLHVEDLRIPTNYYTTSLIGRVVSTTSDSLVLAYHNSAYAYYGGNTEHYPTKTGLRFPSWGTTVPLDSSEWIWNATGPRGSLMDIHGLGSTHSSVLAITEQENQTYYDKYFYYYHFYLVRRPDEHSPDSPIRLRWTPLIQGPNRISMTVSQGTDLLALAWVSNDTICVRVLRDTVWCKTKQFVDRVSDGQRSISNVAVGPDTSIWVVYTALKNSQRHLFLARLSAELDVDSPVTDIDDVRKEIPAAIKLDQNYPNPFNPTTAISYQLSANSFVTLKVLDLLGREVATLVNEARSPGVYTVRWDGSGQPSGVYFYRLQSRGFVETKKMILLR